MKKQGELRCYECSLGGDHWEPYNATSPGQAKSMFLMDLDSDYNYTDVRCRLYGPAHTSIEFIKNARYRNIEFAYCGMVVEVDGAKGLIIGHNDSANLDILFTEGKNKGQTLNCHPNWMMTYFNKKGEIIKEFKE